MSNCNSASPGDGLSDAKHISSISEGGASVTIDSNAAKAESRYLASQSVLNIKNRRVRKTFGAIRGMHPS